MNESALAPLAVALPLLVSALLIGTEKLVPRWIVDSLALSTSSLVAAICFALVGPRIVVHWTSSFSPRGGTAVSIPLVVDPVAAALACLSAVLVSAAFLYSWRYFEEVGALFHVLLLISLAGTVGFCFSGDLFTLYVFFELSSVPFYALTAYRPDEGAPLQGALNLAVVTALAGTLVVAGIALLYSGAGALNLAEAGRALVGSEATAPVVFSLVLVLSGLAVKGAVVPFHFAHVDAHTVAPIPVLAGLGTVLLPLAVYGITRVYWTVFASVPALAESALGPVLLGAGTLTALLAAAMAPVQRNLKRLLAFVSVSHVGVVVVGVGLLDAGGVAAAVLYILGHSLVVGALFLLVGILLHRFGSVDEDELAGRGVTERTLGLLAALSGLALAGMPPFGTFAGKTLLDEALHERGYGALVPALTIASILTGAAVLRGGARIFLAWGARASGRERGTERPETGGRHDRVPRVLVAPIPLLLGASLVLGGAAPWAEDSARGFVDGARYADAVLDGRSAPGVVSPPAKPLGGGAVALGLGSALGAALLGAWLARRPRGGANAVPVRVLRRLHTGHAGDYVVWLSLGLAVFATLMLWTALR